MQKSLKEYEEEIALRMARHQYGGREKDSDEIKAEIQALTREELKCRNTIALSQVEQGSLSAERQSILSEIAENDRQIAELEQFLQS